MRKLKYSYQVGHFQDVFRGIRELGKWGYDGAEIVGVDALFPRSKEILSACKDQGLRVSDVNTLFFNRDLAHPDASVRERDIEYMKTVLHFAAELESPTIVMNPTRIGKLTPLIDIEEEYKLGADSLYQVGEYAATLGIRLAVEAWNRYDTYFINNIDKAKKIVDLVNLPSVGLMLDTFHLNIEEDDMAGAIYKAGKQLYHIHAGDSNRKAPGLGHLDFAPLLKALKEIDYAGYVTMEVLPPAADVLYYMEHSDMSPFTDVYPEAAIRHLKSVEASLTHQQSGG